VTLPLARIAYEWRRVLVPLAVLAVLDVAVYAFVVYPMALRVATAERRAASARQVLETARKDHALAQAVVKSSGLASKNLRRFYGEVLPSDLPAARRMTYARLAQLARETNLLYDRRSFEPDANYEGALDRMAITMDLEGEYRDIREFLYRLESSPEFVVIEGIALSSGTDEEAPLALTLRLATYFEADEEHGG
jgi:Tfp pilus assembly protein PilO